MKSVPEVCELIRSGKNDEFERALNESPDLAEQKTDQGISLLSYAAYCRNPVATESIRTRKRQIDVFEAAAIGDSAEVRDFVKHHPDQINTFSSDGFTLLGLSCFFGHEEMARYLVERGADANRASNNSFKVTPLHSACAVSNYAIVELLLQHGAQVNLSQQSGVTPLHTAAHLGQSRLAELLIKSGANINATLDDGRTPFALAEEKGFTETADLLQKYGAH